MFSPGTVLSWATFAPLAGAALIVLLVVLRFMFDLPQAGGGRGRPPAGARRQRRLAWRPPSPPGGCSTGPLAQVQLVQHFTWIGSFNIEYFLGVDGLSISMVLLSALISFVATIASMPWWSGARAAEMAGMTDTGGERRTTRPKHFSVRMVPGYMALLLLLQTGMMGTFVSLDMFLFYVFWEVMLLPMYFLIGIWGGPRKEYAAIKFFLYTLAGSVLMLLAIIGIYYNSAPAMLVNGHMSEAHTFNLVELARQGPSGQFEKAAPILGMSFAKVGVRGALHRVRHQDPDVPVPHLAARRPRRGPHAHLGDPGRRAPEDGHLRHPALQLPAPAATPPSGRPAPSRSSGSSTSSTPPSCAWRRRT